MKKLFQLLVFSSFLSITQKTFAGDCEADFTYTDSDPVIAFTNLSSGSLSIYYWDFGDGSYSYDENPEHAFLFSGIYDVCLYVYGFSGGDSCYDVTCQSIEIDSADEASCSADFSYFISGTTVYFSNLSDGGGASGLYYSWSFGDGGTSTVMNPIHTYTISGVYTVCVTIETTDSCIDTYCTDIFVTDSSDSEECLADFSFTTGTFPDATYFFTNASQGGVSYAWEFGDGVSSSLEDPDHTFTESGEYVVCLSILCSDSSTSTKCDTLSIILTGVEEAYTNHAFHLYPNPAHDEMSIQFNTQNDAIADISIFNIMGELLMHIYDGKISAGQQTFSTHVASLPEGLYFIIADLGEQGKVIEKIQITH